MPNENGHNISYLVPLLGGKTYTCKAGHEIESGNGEPFKFTLVLGPGQAVQSGPVCPVCLLDFMVINFPQWPKGKTIREAKMSGELSSSVRED